MLYSLEANPALAGLTFGCLEAMLVAVTIQMIFGEL